MHMTALLQQFNGNKHELCRAHSILRIKFVFVLHEKNLRASDLKMFHGISVRRGVRLSRSLQPVHSSVGIKAGIDEAKIKICRVLKATNIRFFHNQCKFGLSTMTVCHANPKPEKL